MTKTIRSMLRKAYRYFGVNEATEVNRRVKDALEYMEQDREHYIELVDVDEPDRETSIKMGVVCKLIPIAQESILNCTDHSTVLYTRTLMLRVLKTDVQYVLCYETGRSSQDSEVSIDGFPIYQAASLEQMKKEMDVILPRQVQPVPNAQQWNNYCHIFEAYTRLLCKMPLNFTPHNTERAFWDLDHSKPVTITADGHSYTGKLVELAKGAHIRRRTDEGLRVFTETYICYMDTTEGPRYLAKIYTHYALTARMKTPPDETVYTQIQLEDLTFYDMQPVYY